MKILLAGFLAIAFPVFAQHNHDQHADHSQAKRKALQSNDKAQLTEILAKNDSLFNAFLKKDNALIVKNAKELAGLVVKSDGPILKELKAKVYSLEGIKSSNKNEDNLKAYEAFLNPLIAIVQQYEVAGKYNVFSCPMVKKSWIQDTEVNKDVKNVYATDMLECGTQDTRF